MILRAIQLLWIGLLLYWLIAALNFEPAQRTEERRWALLRAALTIFVFVFMFSPALRTGWLGKRFVTGSVLVSSIGLVTTAAGVGLAVWARWVLGRNWSAAVSLKQSHVLIRSGPYARIRHPIYSGVVLGLVGTALAIGEWRALVAVSSLFLSWLLKSRKEEALLASAFGPAFIEHRSQTGMFLPRFRRSVPQ